MSFIGPSAASGFAAVFICVSLPLPTLAQASPATDAEASRLSLERLYSLPNLIGTAPKASSWSPDGRYLAFLWNDEGRNFHDVWMLDVGDLDAAPVRVTRMPRADASAIQAGDPVAAAEAHDRLERDRGVSFVTWHPDSRRMLMSFRGDLWLVSPGSEPSRLTQSDPPEALPSYSPRGDALAFLREGDLWLMPVDGPASAAVRKTAIARPDVRLASYRWSPDGSRIAVQEMNQTEVTVRGIPDYLGEEPRLVEVRRAYPGEASVGQRIGVVDATLAPRRSPDVDWIEMGAGPTEGGRPEMVLGYRWSPDGDLLAIDTSDLIAKDRRIFVADIGNGGASPTRLVVREQEPLNETFYYWRIAWSVDSHLLYFLSDREEDYHVWAVAPSQPGAEAMQLTRGAWAVASMHPVDGGLIVVGNRGKAEERHLFRVLDEGGDAVRISGRPGTHSPIVSPDGRHAAVSFSSDGTPPELLLTALGPDGGERRVTHSPVSEFSSYDWVEPAYVSFLSHVDGATLHGRLTLPPNFDPDRSYPAILGSVYTESVRNQWGGRTAHPTWGLDQYLAQEGYILLNVDMRGSWGRGRDHRRGIRLDYGGMDIEDLESGVRFLRTLGYVDMQRVGLWGSSYGGLMTTMSLFRKPGLYAAGIAGAPATSVWHALTGQMAVMLAPEDSPAEYIDSSAFMHAQGLEDPLMIIHGMRDRVVLYKDTVTLVQRLIMLGKDVDLVTLPDSGHAWDNESLTQTRFAFSKMVEFFNRHLGGTER
ncbi:MAG: prolyl oligopeptidase family serine peptidase [Gemmatimonadetes bacterium]|jgi:dipeptidyl-peptidase-4|nr:prolyl oligopeptidase family serine peptidase [Gemmatimonadota bacterium]MEE2847194.1 prolyl oligopeptidase family serine peptidase [Gemmatimonadota bacterium]